MHKLQTHVGRVRFIGMLEGISFLLLLGIAMPAKRIFKVSGGEELVFYIGLAHGVLFVLFCLAIFLAFVGKRLSLGRSALAFGSALFPFGPFLIDRRLAEDEAREIARKAP